jgi:hypothetical protein
MITAINTMVFWNTDEKQMVTDLVVRQPSAAQRCRAASGRRWRGPRRVDGR